MRTHTSVVPRPAFARATDRVRLVVSDGPDRQAMLVIGSDPVRIGTASDADLVLTDSSVSREHVQVRWDGGLLAVVDRTSKNGTFVGGCRIHDALVPVGTELRVGTTTLKLVPDDETLQPTPAALSHYGNLVGTSRVMRQLFTLVDQIATTAVPVLIDGETGVGKHAIALELHARSARGPLITFDCADPIDDLDTVFVNADRGTLVLEDIGELPGELQPTLLRILDRKSVRPANRAIDVRVIAISRANLGHALTTGALRDDLYYRLAVIQITVPPLRDRREDIAVLAHHIAGARLALDEVAVRELGEHDWPGNVRELRNVIESAVATGRLGTASSSPASELAIRTFREAKAELVDAFERRYFEELMTRFNSLHGAADAAGMDRKHLRTLLRRHGFR